MSYNDLSDYITCFGYHEIDRLVSENAKLRSQLPEGMKHCTIQFKSCELGHGWLTATNWVQHGCPTCERNRLIELLQLMVNEIKIFFNIHDNAYLDSLNGENLLSIYNKMKVVINEFAKTL